MNQDDIDQILANEEEITPSPGFLASVMNAVETERIAPQRLPFPWMRMMPGLLALGAAHAGALWQGISTLNGPAVLESLTMMSTLAANVGLPWVVATAGIATLSVVVFSSLIPGRSYS